MTQPDGTGSSEPQLVDWELAAATATRLTRPGPEVSREEAAEVVESLRRAATTAQGHVRDYTGLVAPASEAPVLIVDRPSWCRANAEGLRELLTPVGEILRAKRPQMGSGTILDQVGPKVTGVETGALLAYVATKILGQYDPYWEGAEAGQRGRLLLVAPNIVQVQRELELDAEEFQLWVCLHEETHRVQFTAVAWLTDHVRGQVAKFVEAADLDASALGRRLREVLEYLIGAVRGEEDDRTIIDIVQTPGQREVLDRITAVMSLVEGHAEFVMDGVGPAVVPSVDVIRSKFQKRRENVTGMDRLIRRVLGLDAKLRQYRDGARFVRGVVDRVGMDGFNRVWESPATLPTLAEISDPASWVTRVHGAAA
jgi:coenzyme F420 biosynthesis associated uncharacterized protein